MGKFVYSLVAVFTVELCLWLFAGVEYVQTTLFNFILHPTTTSAFYQTIYAAMLAVTATIIVASLFSQFNIYGLYATISLVLITFMISFIHFVSFAYGELSSVLSPEFTLAVTSLLSAPLLITYIIGTAEWIRSN